jgi:hypothetical protein
MQWKGKCTHSRSAENVVERLGEQVAGVETRLRGRHETYVRNPRASRVAETVDELEVGGDPRGLWSSDQVSDDEMWRGEHFGGGGGPREYCTHQTLTGRARLGHTSGTGGDIRYVWEDVVARAITGVAEDRSKRVDTHVCTLALRQASIVKGEVDSRAVQEERIPPAP